MEKELLQHLEFLTAIRPFKNWRNLESLKVASDYIQAELETYGLTIRQQKWNYGEFEYTNIIASYKPNLPKRLIVGAHYDIYDEQPGADDNTSGVAGLLQLAKMTMETEPDLPYGIDFVAYCLEEPPHFGTKNMGSYVHAESLDKSNTDVVGMICLDMIGYFSDEPNSQRYPMPELAQKFPTVGNYIAVIGHQDHSLFSNQVAKAMRAANAIDLHMINFPSSDGLAGLSDHRNYWYFGFDAVMINDTATFRNPNYHKVTDTVDTLDLEKMAAVVEAVFNAIRTPLIQSERTITEKDPEDPIAPKKDHLSFMRRLIMWLKALFRK